MATETSHAYAHLHSLLQKLARAEQLLDHGPKRIALGEKKVKLAEAACDEQREKIKQLRKTADQSSMNLKSREADLSKLALRLNEASSNKEYDIIQGQIQTKKAEDAQLEDEVLALLEDVDTAQAELETLEQALQETRETLDETRTDVASREPGLQEDAERLRSEIAEAETVIPGGEARSTYQRLKGAQGASALSRVDDGYCVECNTSMTPQDAVRLNLGEFVLCRACGRVLYRIDAD